MTDAQIVAAARVEKRLYAPLPWRIVAADGRPLTVPSTGLPRLLAFPTKRAAVAALDNLRRSYAEEAA